MDCSKCEIYKETNGIGKLECKKCPKYKRFHVSNAPRPPLIFEQLSELIKESCADQQKTLNILQAIQQLPLEKSVPLMMQYLLNATLSDIAKYHKISAPAVYKKNNKTIEIIKEMLHAG